MNGRNPEDNLDFVDESEKPLLRTLNGYLMRLSAGEIVTPEAIHSDLAAEQLSPTLNAFVVYLYLEASDTDPGYVSARFIREAIDFEAKRSPGRAAGMALSAAERYLAFGDPIWRPAFSLPVGVSQHRQFRTRRVWCARRRSGLKFPSSQMAV